MSKDIPDSDERFLSRWSRRKLHPGESEQDEAQKNLSDPAMSNAALVDSGADVKALAEQEDQQPVLTDDDMPPIESLHEDSDFSGFMSPGVSEELRKLALRKLFKGGAFNVVDGLDDYDEDFTSFEKLGDIITSDMRYQMERMAESLDQEEDETEEDSVQKMPEEHAQEEDVQEETSLTAKDEPDAMQVNEDQTAGARDEPMSMENQVNATSDAVNRELPLEKQS